MISDIVFADVEDRPVPDPPAPADEQIVRKFESGDLLHESSDPSSTAVLEHAEDFFNEDEDNDCDDDDDDEKREKRLRRKRKLEARRLTAKRRSSENIRNAWSVKEVEEICTFLETEVKNKTLPSSTRVRRLHRMGTHVRKRSLSSLKNKVIRIFDRL